ncbi:MAG: glycine--tRNA ligase subunit beta [Spirochaetia bacterium]|nr:glycine--tRNA ligase subunit beta [Spirochaetota bacterium]MDW8112398.1 glycine--tRNA ligase subunit beta [Spirochaetia bacterium]
MARDFLLEVGVEEIPHTYLASTHKQFEAFFKQMLSNYNLNYSSLKTFSTPRRLGVLIEELDEKQSDRKVIKKGPSKNLAYTNDGQPTQALKGFLSSVSSMEGELKVLKEGDKEFIFFEGIQKGIDTKEILKNEIPKALKTLEFPKTMRWSDIDYQFVRPIRWIVCVFGSEVIDIEIARVKSSNLSYGHRFIGENVAINDPKDYEKLLETKGKVIPSPEKRKRIILEKVEEFKSRLKLDAVLSKELLEEITNLVEYPECAVGSFSEDFLSVPSEILISEMVEKQKFIPLLKEGKLTNKFLIITNTIPNDNIIKGNEKVISARLNDGKFLYEEDTKKSIDFFVNKTKELIFFEGLGTVYDKLGRMRKLSEIVLDKLGVSDVRDEIVRASSICKFDLTTGVVYEFPELQGIIGYHYSLIFKESDNVANYIKEHYKPVSADDELPSTFGGTVVSIVDKLDNLFSLYSAGKKVTGSSDPYGLRRQVLGISRMLINKSLDFDIVEVFESAKSIYQEFFNREYEIIEDDIRTFVSTRLKSFLKEMGFKTDEVEATIKTTTNPYDAYLRVKTVSLFRDRGEFVNVAVLFKRIRNILSEAKFTSPQPVDTSILTDEEKLLYSLITSKETIVTGMMREKNYEDVLNTLLEFREPVHRFFEKVFVMDENTKIRDNRLSILHRLYTMFEQFIDFNAVEFA